MGLSHETYCGIRDIIRGEIDTTVTALRTASWSKEGGTGEGLAAYRDRLRGYLDELAPLDRDDPPAQPAATGTEDAAELRELATTIASIVDVDMPTGYLAEEIGKLFALADRIAAPTTGTSTIPLDVHAELVGLAMDMVNAWEVFRHTRLIAAPYLGWAAATEASCEAVYRWIAKHPVRTNDGERGAASGPEEAIAAGIDAVACDIGSSIDDIGRLTTSVDTPAQWQEQLHALADRVVALGADRLAPRTAGEGTGSCPGFVPSPNGWCLNCGGDNAAHPAGSEDAEGAGL